MGFGSSGESVIVVMDADRNRGKVDALNWALNNVVRPKDTVIVLGVLCDCCKKSSCFPFDIGIGVTAIWERLDFSSQGEKSLKLLEEEITKKKEEYQHTLEPYHRQCKRNEVKLEMKLVAGFSPKVVTVEEAQNNNTRWIVLDSHLKKDRFCIYSQVGCNIAVLKHNDVATIMPSLAPEGSGSSVMSEKPHKEDGNAAKEDKVPGSSPPIPSWYPLSWQPGFPREFTHAELESITNGFPNEDIIFENENLKVYQGILLKAPVFVKCFSGDHERFRAELKVYNRVRHRNILNLIGYCRMDDSMFLLSDYPCQGSLDKHLRCDELAKNLSWKIRWDIALGIGGCLRYLHEECLYGPLLHLAVTSGHIFLSRSFSALLTNFSLAKWLEDDDDAFEKTSSMEGSIKHTTLMGNERFSIDVYAYGLLLLELITGQKSFGFDTREGQNMVDWALPLLENRYLSQLMDPRLICSGDTKEVCYMGSAALLCLKNRSGPWPCMSEVVALVQGDRFTMSQW
ncbi:putative serine/threonine-protein kinase PBL16 [Tasmannia lanceolata]|uniref:putative serine/threonine-protein kinase PBL16 n=1 Tax=Tasmannia lanceolata TaxID=3420 RepID=UPI004063BE46